MTGAEKMAILQKLQRNEISADEAARLLEGGASYTAPPPPPPPPTSSYNSNGPAPSYSYGERPPRGESILSGLGRKFDVFMHDMEPKARKFAETVADKTANAADYISKQLSTPRPAPPRPTGSYAPPPPAPYAPPQQPTTSYTPPPPPYAPPTSSGTEVTLEKRVLNMNSELAIAGLNAPVSLKGYNGDKITLRVVYKLKRSGVPRIELMQLGDKYFLDYNPDDFDKIAVDAFLPTGMFYTIKVSGVNAPLSVSSIETTYIEADVLNGKLELSQIRAAHIKADVQNGELRLSKIFAQKMSAECSNGIFMATDTDIQEFEVEGFNSQATVSMTMFREFDEYIWSLEASNGSLKVLLPSAPAVGYHIKGSASLGDIRIGLTGITYILNEKSNAEVQSFNYSSAAQHVKLMLSTSNGPLIVG